MKKLITILAVVAVILSGNIAFARGNRHQEPSPTPAPVATTTTVWGAYTGNTDASMAAFEQSVGKKMAIDAMFWGWDAPFPQTTAGAQGKTLLIFWEPTFGYNAINSGKYDSYIKQFAQGAKAYGFPIILVPFDEFNLNETPYGNTINGNTPQNFVSAWQHVHNIFASVGATNIKFGLDYNNVSIPSVPFSSFYAGAAYVDYIGIDAFNFGGTTYASQMSNAMAQAVGFGKPIYIMSTGSVQPQPDWITALGAQQGIAGWVWFNEAPFNITSASLPTFKGIIK